jgi:hypothetical protein
MMKRPMVELATNGMSAAELFTQWTEYDRLRDEIGAMVEGMIAEWQQEADSVRKAHLGAELEEIGPQYAVLSAWVDLFRSAWIFARYGCASRFIVDDTTRMTSEEPPW